MCKDLCESVHSWHLNASPYWFSVTTFDGISPPSSALKQTSTHIVAVCNDQKKKSKQCRLGYCSLPCSRHTESTQMFDAVTLLYRRFKTFPSTHLRLGRGRNLGRRSDHVAENTFTYTHRSTTLAIRGTDNHRRRSEGQKARTRHTHAHTRTYTLD